MAIACTVICIVALLGLLRSEQTASARGRYLSKPLASLAFIVVALTLGALDSGTYGYWIAAGLVLGAVGDVALMFESERAFLVGLVAFLLGHVAYVVALSGVTPLVAWIAPWTLAPLVSSALVLRWLWPHLGKMRGPVIAYVLVITAMVVGALAVQTSARVALDARAALLLTVGALLFFVSDIAVARNKFVSPGVVNRMWGLPAYYAAQLLIAWSLIPPSAAP
jgi:uncharacterized membrane protein YhhN